MNDATDEPHLPEPAEPDPMTPKRRALIDGMVWRGLKPTDAAVEAGMTERNARMCAQDPAFRAALNREMAAFKASQRPRSVLGTSIAWQSCATRMRPREPPSRQSGCLRIWRTRPPPSDPRMCS